MNSNVNIEYANAYSEVLEVLNNMSKEDYNKIPKDMLEMFKTNCNNEYQFRYDLNKKFEQQEISKRAKLILAILFRDYWATPYQKEKIIAKQNYERQKLEQQKFEKYNPERIFENKRQPIIEEIKNINSMIEVKEEKWYQKIFKLIKNLFKRK
jgi:hypothetical protein